MSAYASLSLTNTAGPGNAVSIANGSPWPTEYSVYIQTTGYPVFNMQAEGSLLGFTWNPLFGPFTVKGDYPFNAIIGQLRSGGIQSVPSYPMVRLNLLEIYPSMVSATARFAGSISGTTLTIDGTPPIVGTIAIGQTIVAMGQVPGDGSALGTAILPGTQIVSGSGTSWQVNLSQHVVDEWMYSAVTPLVSGTIVTGP